jgi:GDP-4-dehydro-6-deoxy-D-mannose reductase
VLVTGAAGFVGRFMVEALEDDYNVTGLGQESRPAWFPADADWYRADLLNPDSLADLPRGLFAVVHLAGNTVPSAFRDESAVQQNVEMTRNLLDRVDTDRFLLASSGLVYAPGRTPRTEESPIDPQGPYGRSKYLCEELVRSYGAKLTARIARPFNHIGPGMQPALAIPSIIRRVLDARENDGPIEMLGQDSIRDFIDVRDVVAAYKALIELDSVEHDAYNVCTGVPTSIRTVVQTALDILGLERDIVFAEQALSSDDTSRIVGDSTRLKQDTGWRSGFTLQDSLLSILEPEL